MRIIMIGDAGGKVPDMNSDLPNFEHVFLRQTE